MSRKARKFKAFFRPKLGDLQKKKKKKKKRSSPKFRVIFLPISQIQTFEGNSFRMGGAIFHFSQKISLKSIKNMRFCILHQPMGGARAPPAPPPGYATGQGLRNWIVGPFLWSSPLFVRKMQLKYH